MEVLSAALNLNTSQALSLIIQQPALMYEISSEGIGNRLELLATVFGTSSEAAREMVLQQPVSANTFADERLLVSSMVPLPGNMFFLHVFHVTYALLWCCSALSTSSNSSPSVYYHAFASATNVHGTVQMLLSCLHSPICNVIWSMQVLVVIAPVTLRAALATFTNKFGKSTDDVRQLFMSDPGTAMALGYMNSSNVAEQWASRLGLNPEVGGVRCICPKPCSSSGACEIFPLLCDGCVQR